MLTLHANPMSPYSQRVHLLLEETGRPYRYQLVNLGKGDQRRDEFRALNPLGQVPTIELDGFGMGESNAILRYLAAKWERFDLYPANLEDRARVDTWVEFGSLHVGRFIQSMAWNLHWGPSFGQPRNDRLVEESRDALGRNLPKLERHLAGRSYLAGAGLTLADLSLLPLAAQWRVADLTLTDFPSCRGWIDRMVERPAWKRVMTQTETMLAQLRG